MRPTRLGCSASLPPGHALAAVVVVGNGGAGAEAGGAAAARGEGPAAGHLLLPHQPAPMRRPSCSASSTTSSCSAPPSSYPPHRARPPDERWQCTSPPPDGPPRRCVAPLLLCLTPLTGWMEEEKARVIQTLLFVAGHQHADPELPRHAPLSSGRGLLHLRRAHHLHHPRRPLQRHCRSPREIRAHS